MSSGSRGLHLEETIQSTRIIANTFSRYQTTTPADLTGEKNALAWLELNVAVSAEFEQFADRLE